MLCQERPRRSRLTTAILHAYFPVVINLRAYLLQIIDSGTPQIRRKDDEVPTMSQSFLPQDNDTVAYKTLVNESLVAFKSDGAFIEPKQRRFISSPPMMYMREVIDHAQARILKFKRPMHTITLGYRFISDNGELGKRNAGHMGITNHFVNTIVTALQSPEWEALLQRIGVDAMFHLLTEAYVFVPLPNDCLCQMTGEPVIFIKPTGGVDLFNGPTNNSAPPVLAKTPKRKFNESGRGSTEPPAKRLKLSESASSSTSTAKGNSNIRIEEHTPADISFPRLKMLHSRPIRVPHTNDFVVGLPPLHILNRIRPSYFRQPVNSAPEYSDLDPRKLLSDARHLSKYVFPQQYRLSSAGKLFRRNGAYERNQPDFMNREIEIQVAGKCKTPKRVKGALSLLERLLWKHGKCGYKALLNKLCPTKILHNGAQRIDSSMILEILSEDTSQPTLRTQRSLMNSSMDSSGRRIPPEGLTQAELHAKTKPQFSEFTCSYIEVYRFVAVITQLVIPKALWGSNANYKLVMRYVKEFIVSRRYESLSLHYVLQGFSTAACDWLAPPGKAIKQTRVCVSDALKRRELLEDFLFWYFDSFVLQLLKTNFYITESSAFRNRLLYFRQDDWNTLCKPLIDKLTGTTFQRISQPEAEELLRQRQLGFSFVRLLPKETGVRPIVNLRSSKPITSINAAGSGKSINQILQSAFQILAYERKSRPALLGASVFNPDEIHARLKAFKNRLPKDTTGKTPKLYFVKVDVQACFDTIEQDKLLNILHTLLSEDGYTIPRFGKISAVAGKIRRNFAKTAVPESEHPHFLKYASDLASVLRCTIFSDQVVYQNAKKTDVLRLLEEHITENIVKIGPNYFKQMVGIPQGSVLSSILCCFFYGDMEKSRHGRFMDDPANLLLRMIDDYLFVTSNQSTAREFLDMMIKGHPEYGCFIGKEKTLTNFDYDEEIMNVTDAGQRTFPWCGYAIDVNTLAVSVDYTRFYGTDLKNTLTVGRIRKPGNMFVHRMLRLAKARSHIIYHDPELNTEKDIYVNIYQNFLILAMKAHGYLCDWGISTKLNTNFIHAAIRRIIHYTYLSLRSNRVKSTARQLAPSSKCNLKQSVINWLGMHAFHTVFSRKSRFHRSLLLFFDREMARAKHQHFAKQYRHIIRDGLENILQIEF